MQILIKIAINKEIIATAAIREGNVIIDNSLVSYLENTLICCLLPFIYSLLDIAI